jgi:outer membrane protein assembly factor BamD (BamD/ComL family)
MRFTRYIITQAILFIILLQLAITSSAQYGISFDVKKPKEYENRVLRSEKSDQKKFSLPKRFIQNTITHYNYFFNANNKLNEVLERAKLNYKDDYSKLLPFYNYTLDVTAADSIQLDSINYKAQTGIVLHDLRSDWADNLYLLWGASYYLQKEFDSAYLMFQFINYAFAEKESDGYYRTIGSNRDGNQATSISTKEKSSLPRKIFAEPPSRNDAFIWQIRNYLAQNKFAEAGSLIVTLKNDPVFPTRLANDLEEVQAYLFYKQNMWDSAASHLVNALGAAVNKQERARWEYLLAQLYERTGQFEQSEAYYAKAIGHTTDPILDIYARLFSIRVNKDGGENYIENNIATLIKMAKRDKYQDYRDIIYYMAAQMELERNNVDGALTLLLRSIKYTSNSPSQRNKAFLQLAELSFGKRLYRDAYNFYDSLRLDDPEIKDPEAITARKTILGLIASNVETIARQDSLQRLAAMAEADRTDIVKKLTKQLRKKQGLKEDEAMTTGSRAEQKAPASLFDETKSKGEWYFYNSNSRQKGYADFRSRWGNRPNKDNWRRSAGLAAGPVNRADNKVNNPATEGKTTDAQVANAPEEINFESLYKNIPLTQDQMVVSNDSIQKAMLTLGSIYIQKLEDCAAGTDILEQFRTRYPQHPEMDEALFNLYYCYNKNGETAKADALKKLMTDKYPGNRFTTIINTGKDPLSKSSDGVATKTYEQIYDQFLEGNFTEAIAQKKVADSLYGSHHWTPQLLYIESVYYIKQREDSIAKLKLKAIINKYNGTPLGNKAVTMLDVLNRRKEIEDELTKLVLKVPVEDTTVRRPADIANVTDDVTLPDDSTVSRPALTAPIAIDKTTGKPIIDSATGKPKVLPPGRPPVVINNKPVVIDTTTAKPVPTLPTSVFAYTPEAPHYVLIVLNKVDVIFVNEAKNAFFRYNKDTYYNKQMQAELVDIDNDNKLLLISPFKNAQEAIQYVDVTRPKTASEILPWLKIGKYTYSIITEKNLELLKGNKDIEKYRQFIEGNIPGKF